MSNSTKIRVGTWNQKEPETVTEHFECAAWYRDVKMEVGEYPVYIYVNWTNVKEGHPGHSLYIPFEGKVTGASFSALFGGVPIRDDNGKPIDRGSEQVGNTQGGCKRLALWGRSFEVHVQEGTLCLDPELINENGNLAKRGQEFWDYVRSHDLIVN